MEYVSKLFKIKRLLLTGSSKAWVCCRSPAGFVGCVLAGGGASAGLITTPEEYYRVPSITVKTK
jgi:hypothetical protein